MIGKSVPYAPTCEVISLTTAECITLVEMLIITYYFRADLIHLLTAMVANTFKS